MAHPEHVTATDFHRALNVAERWITINREAINAINVYPVPDGDTGTNMLLTLRAAIEAGSEAVDGSVGRYLAAVSRGVLLGARGNSGVILSQMVRGLAESLEDHEQVDAPALAAGLQAASIASYEVVGDPVEGTMLTVLREAAAAAVAAAGGLPAMLRALVDEAHASVERTPQLLQRLRDAGVVDSGGLGVAVILEGLRCGLLDEPLPATPLTVDTRVDLSGVAHEGHGFCIEYLVSGEQIDRPALQSALSAAGGESLLVVGDATAVHVHVHMDESEAALTIGATAGAVEAVKVEDMQAQHDAWASGTANGAREPGGEPLPGLAMVAVARGDGIVRAFLSLGAAEVIDGGPSGKASTDELLAAARRAGRERVAILPNDPDVLMAAEQAARAEPELIEVVPSRSVAAGLAAAVSYLPDGDAGRVLEDMRHAAGATRVIQLTRAARDATVDGVAVREGEAIAMFEGRLVASAGTLEEALSASLPRAVDERSEIVTLYLGEDAGPDVDARVIEVITAAYPQLEIEVIDGGQPHYPYMLAIE